MTDGWRSWDLNFFPDRNQAFSQKAVLLSLAIPHKDLETNSHFLNLVFMSLEFWVDPSKFIYIPVYQESPLTSQLYFFIVIDNNSCLKTLELSLSFFFKSRWTFSSLVLRRAFSFLSLPFITSSFCPVWSPFLCLWMASVPHPWWVVSAQVEGEGTLPEHLPCPRHFLNMDYRP